MGRAKHCQTVAIGKKTYRYTVVIEKETDPEFQGYHNAYVPALPGCVSYGRSEQEALANIREAIASYLLSLLDAGKTTT